MNRVMGQGALATAIAALLSSASFEVSAQTQPASTALEEIVVSARRRAEASLDVPMAMNVFSAAEIQAAGIERPQDFIALTPNMSMVQTQNQGTSFITVRGISQARNSEPSVAVLIDGVQMANPSQFNQELVDIESIQVLKGPQGGIYGRNAIGGAILITTRAPSDAFEGSVTAGYESGPGYKLRGTVSGPMSDTLRYRASLSVFDTDGHINNAYLGEEADPFRDITARVRLSWEPTADLDVDWRGYVSQVDTQALYFNITEDVNDTSLPVRVNNPGENERDMYGTSLMLNWSTPGGVFTSISAFDKLQELLTGDQFDFLPIEESVLFQFFGADQAQHQFLDVEAFSQEFRFASPEERRLRWIAGVWGIWTDRFISTGNVFDLGTGVVPRVKRQPLPMFNPQFTYLADSQDNFAWAVFGDLAYDITNRLEASLALRYDRDRRRNTTETPEQFIPEGLADQAFPGQVRRQTWDEWQPKATLRYKPTLDSTLYAGFSRGFRSGGFNQTGVGAAGIAGIDDIFDRETADTWEAGAKAEFLDRRVTTELNLFYTRAKGTYYFVFDPNTSTQNLGNLDRVDYKGAELEVRALLAEGLDGYVSMGYTDSEIKASRRDPDDVGNQAPLVSEYTVNLGVQYRRNVPGWGGIGVFVRPDLEIIGPTWFYPDNFTRRDPVTLLNLRAGVEADNWSLVAWARNLNDETYNAEWSPGPQFFPSPGYTNNFVFKAPPRRWGVDLTYRF